MPDDGAFGGSDPGGVVIPCPFENPPHWLEIELRDQDGRLVPFEEYLIKLPTGEEVRGFLDGTGHARLDGIEVAGTCQVSFPGIDRDAWRIESSGPAREPALL
jgi:hypothetical protein